MLGARDLHQSKAQLLLMLHRLATIHNAADLEVGTGRLLQHRRSNNKVIATIVIMAARLPHDVLNLWSPICNPRFGAGYVGSGMGTFGSSPIGSYVLPIHIYGLSPTVFELFSWLQRRFRPSARPIRIR